MNPSSGTLYGICRSSQHFQGFVVPRVLWPCFVTVVLSTNILLTIMPIPQVLVLHGMSSVYLDDMDRSVTCQWFHDFFSLTWFALFYLLGFGDSSQHFTEANASFVEEWPLPGSAGDLICADSDLKQGLNHMQGKSFCVISFFFYLVSNFWKYLTFVLSLWPCLFLNKHSIFLKLGMFSECVFTWAFSF